MLQLHQVFADYETKRMQNLQSHLLLGQTKLIPSPGHQSEESLLVDEKVTDLLGHVSQTLDWIETGFSKETKESYSL